MIDVQPSRPPLREDQDLLLEFYRQMQLIRRFEETMLDLFAQGLLNGTVHTCMGQESCAVGVINALDKDRDVVFSNHRGHGHYIALTDDAEGLAAEILGRSGGICGGVGGSQHLHRGNFYTSGIQGGIVPVATGMALAEREKRSGAIVVACLGDGTLGEGVVYESLNIASKWSLPILFVIENNHYAQTTPVGLAHAGQLAARPRAFDIDGETIVADDVLAVHAEAQRWVRQVRSSLRPAFLCLETDRLGPHSKGDDTRPREEIEAYRNRDPLAKLAASLPEAQRVEVAQSVELRIGRAVQRAMAMPAQEFAEYRRRMVAQGVYAG
jgi:TPP-dependent pyruvate/acetoin dehydrogenase alpha subunit